MTPSTTLDTLVCPMTTGDAMTAAPAPDVSPLNTIRLTGTELVDAWTNAGRNRVRAIADAATLKALRGVAPMLNEYLNGRMSKQGLNAARALLDALEGVQP